MTHELIALLILVVVIGVVAWLVLLILDQIPMEAPFKQIARALVMIVALLIVLLKLLPILGIAI